MASKPEQIQKLVQQIREWNASRLDLFEISLPNEVKPILVPVNSEVTASTPGLKHLGWVSCQQLASVYTSLCFIIGSIYNPQN